jgi:hypothetical protein
MTNASALVRVRPNAQWQYLMGNGVMRNFDLELAANPTFQESKIARQSSSGGSVLRGGRAVCKPFRQTEKSGEFGDDSIQHPPG